MFPLMSLTCLSFTVRAYLFPFSLLHSASFASSKLLAALWIIKLADFVFCLIMIYKLDTARCFGLGPLTVSDQASVDEEMFVFYIRVTNYLLIPRMIMDNIQSCNTKLRATRVQTCIFVSSDSTNRFGNLCLWLPVFEHCASVCLLGHSEIVSRSPKWNGFNEDQWTKLIYEIQTE